MGAMASWATAQPMLQRALPALMCPSWCRATTRLRRSAPALLIRAPWSRLARLGVGVSRNRIKSSRGQSPCFLVLHPTCPCALIAGSSMYGSLGNGADPLKDAFSDIPVAVLSNRTFRSITCGWGHTCALDEESRAWCWGEFKPFVTGHGVQTTRH